MAVPPKSMRQGIYWVQTALKIQRQQQRDALRAERDSAFNELREQAISFEREWVEPIADIEMSPTEAKAVISEVKALRKIVGTNALKSRLTTKNLERTSFRLLNAIFNVAFVAIKYGVRKSRPPTVRWSQIECVVYLAEVPYMHLKYGKSVNPFECTVPVQSITRSTR
jgi:hypothetical protein